MATSYDYSTGRIERDFRFVKVYEPCHRSQLPCRAGSSWCNKCKHYNGTIHLTGGGEMVGYIGCKHPDAQDSQGYEIALEYFYEKFEQQALSALCY